VVVLTASQATLETDASTTTRLLQTNVDAAQYGPVAVDGSRHGGYQGGQKMGLQYGRFTSNRIAGLPMLAARSTHRTVSSDEKPSFSQVSFRDVDGLQDRRQHDQGKVPGGDPQDVQHPERPGLRGSGSLSGRIVTGWRREDGVCGGEGGGGYGWGGGYGQQQSGYSGGYGQSGRNSDVYSWALGVWALGVGEGGGGWYELPAMPHRTTFQEWFFPFLIVCGVSRFDCCFSAVERRFTTRDASTATAGI